MVIEGIRIRPLAYGETAVLQRVFDGMSAESRYLRYHTPMPRLTSAYKEALTCVDGRRHVALVAERDTGEPVGLGRLIAVGRQRVEIALEVVDAAQRQGIGQELIARLVELAGTLGFSVVQCSVLPANAVVLRLVRRLFPAARSRVAESTVQVEIPLSA